MVNPGLHNPEDDEDKLGFEHENLEGFVPPMNTDTEIREALEKAFDYRGDVTVTLKTGENIQGYIYDRKANSSSLAECLIRIMPQAGGKQNIRYSDIAALAFTGKDTAAGKSFEAWVKKYKEKKAAGETNIGIDSEPLD